MNLAESYRDTLERINTAWTAIIDEHNIGCNCEPSGACDVCEITFLLEECLG